MKAKTAIAYSRAKTNNRFETISIISFNTSIRQVFIRLKIYISTNLPAKKTTTLMKIKYSRGK